MQDAAVSASVGKNREALAQLFHADKNKDIVLHEVRTASGVRCLVAYIDGMVNGEKISEFIIRPITSFTGGQIEPRALLQIQSFTEAESMSDAARGILDGDTAVFIDGASACFVCETKGFDRRSVSQPNIETTTKGSQEAFTESIRTNTSMIRRIIKSADLCTEFMRVGEINNGMCAIMYLDSIVNKEILAEIKKRIASIKGDYINGAGMLSQMIEDNPWSLFPTHLMTERPDRSARYINMGRVVVIADGTPFAIVLPVTLAILLDSPEGVSLRWQNGTYTRILRMFALFCTTMLSGIYLALILFHRELIPTSLLVSIVESRSKIPFPSIFEVIIMELFFELVREAGLRIPNMLGNAIGIVGALILGQAAVEASLVSPVTLIIVALSGLGNSALPDYELAFGIRTIKLFFIIMGGSFGFVGIGVALAVVLAMLSNQNSVGVPMLSVQSLRWSAGTSVLHQSPLWKQEHRPRELHPQKDRMAPELSRPWIKQQEEEE